MLGIARCGGSDRVAVGGGWDTEVTDGGPGMLGIVGCGTSDGVVAGGCWGMGVAVGPLGILGMIAVGLLGIVGIVDVVPCAAVVRVRFAARGVGVGRWFGGSRTRFRVLAVSEAALSSATLDSVVRRRGVRRRGSGVGGSSLGWFMFCAGVFGSGGIRVGI
jgi:hypothetical protein